MLLLLTDFMPCRSKSLRYWSCRIFCVVTNHAPGAKSPVVSGGRVALRYLATVTPIADLPTPVGSSARTNRLPSAKELRMKLIASSCLGRGCDMGKWEIQSCVVIMQSLYLV